MKLTKGMLRKLIKEEIEELSTEATPMSEASLADEGGKSIGDTWEEKNQSLRAAVFELAKLYDDPKNKFEELDPAGHRNDLLKAFILDFKDRRDPNNLVSELQSFAVIVMAKAFALYSGQ